VLLGVGIAILVVLYFVPTFIAIARKHHWIVRILAVNLLFGWTMIGWVVALHMSSTSRTKVNAYWRPPTGGAGSQLPGSGGGGPSSFIPSQGDDK